jgi:HAE1 family hydrophobic/amphiphilic exporter-1
MKRPEIQYAITLIPTSLNIKWILMSSELRMRVWKSQRYSTLCRGIMVVCTDFNKFGKQYRVMIQAKPEDRANLESIISM